MRKILCQTMFGIMKKDEDVVVLNADLEGPNGLSALRKTFGERVINVGIQEQNMACVAAGMSSYGLKPFICTFTPFATRRICDQIAVSCAYAKQNVKIIGSDPGVAAEFNGGTHMSMEDIGVLRSIPKITIVEPTDNVQLKSLLPQITNYNGTVYIRLFRKEPAPIFEEGTNFDLFKSFKIKDGEDVTIFCCGIMVDESIKASKILQNKGINAEIINLYTIKPIDKDAIIESAKKTKAVVVAENHNTIGGLASAVCEVLSTHAPTKLSAIGVKDEFGQVGKMPYLKQVYQMRAEDIAAAAKDLLN